MRSFQLDILKFVAIVLVMLQHAWSMMGLGSLPPLVEQAAACSWIGVPIFLMVSGCLQIKPVASISGFYAKRAKRILPAFLLWSVVVYVISAFMGKYEGIGSASEALKSFVPFLIQGKVNSAFWYVYMICGVLLLAPVLSAAYCSAGGRVLLRLSVVVWLAVAMLKDLLPGFAFLEFFPIPLKHLGYFICGKCVAVELDSVGDRSRIRRPAFCVAGLAWVASIAVAALFHRCDTLEIITAAALFTGVMACEPEGCKGFVTAVSNCSYAIYLSHFIIIGGLYTFLPMSPLTPFLTVAVVLAAETLAFSLIGKSGRFPGWLIGISR